MGFLQQIEIENFKSWRGKQVIGPFMRFNCIIGPNGSGKSNVMDALSFALGERASTLRVKHLSELIHGAHIGRPVSNSATVALRYLNDDETELLFSRTVNGDSSEYRVNGVRVSSAAYTEELQKIGVITKAQNCLVFQGAVESICMKDPKERTKIMEYISQSREFAAEYNERKEALMKAKEDTQFYFNRKKSAAVEKKQIFQDKAEAQKYQDLLDQLSENQLKICLAELYHNETHINVINDDLKDRQLAAGTKNHEMTNLEKMFRDEKKEHGRLCRELLLLEKEIRGQEQLVSQSQSNYIKAKVNITHHRKKTEQLRDSMKRSQKLLAEKEQELVAGREEITEIKRNLEIYENQLQEERAARGSHIQLDRDQMKAYKELKELAQKQGAFLDQQAKRLDCQVKADSEKITIDQQTKEGLKVVIKNHQNRLEELKSREEKLMEYITSKKSSLEESHQQEKSLTEEIEHVNKRSKEVNQELNQVAEELRNARLSSHESKRQHQRRELIQKLRTLFPRDVYGRLSDLCSPIHKKYQLAVTKVFASNMSAIVVTTEKVARDCIKFVKEERADTETFLPIDYLVVNPLNERLREIPGAKLVVDVVQVNAGPGASELKRVVQYVCGNALVCETLKEARSVAFDRGERLRTVTLDGTLFKTSGVISGGSNYLRTKAQIWDEKDMLKMKEQKDSLMTELRDLMKQKRKEFELKQVSSLIHGVQTRLRCSQTELDYIQKKAIPKHKMEISHLESEMSNIHSQVQMQKANLDANNEELTKIRQEVDKVEDLVFLDFCAALGLDSIRQFEQEYLKGQADESQKRLEYEKHCTRLKEQLDFEENDLEQRKKKLVKMEEAIRDEERLASEQKEEEKRLAKVVQQEQKKLQDFQNQLDTLKDQVTSAKDGMEKKTHALRIINKELTKLQLEVMNVEAALEQKRLVRHNMLLNCKIRDLPIILQEGNLDDISEEQLTQESQTTLASSDVYEREALLVIDYSQLSDDFKNLDSELDIKTFLEKQQGIITSLEDVLQRTAAPNLKSLEKMNTVKENFLEVMRAFEASTRSARKYNLEFERIKSKRLNRFNKCFDHVCVVIDQIYKRICKNSSAQAILSAENPDEPYLGGINYNCVAPGKRFMSMDNLSGGEKAVAALALLFAIHSYSPAPFFVLDEVDAALDNSNIGKVTSFIREESKSNMQIIVISLKEEFFSKADALQGVYSDFDGCMYSRMLTFDLRPYPLTDEEQNSENRTP